MEDKQADLAGPGIGNYDDLEKILPNGLQPYTKSKGNDESPLLSEKLHRGELVQGTESDNGSGSSNRGR